MGKIRYCKCGHTKKDDHRKEVNILGLKLKELSNCKKCECRKYIPRAFPDKADRLAHYLLLSCVVLIVAVTAWAAFVLEQGYELLSKSDPTHLLTKTAFTYKDVLQIMPLLLILFAIWFSMITFEAVLDYRKNKNTPMKPIDPKDDNTHKTD